MTKRIGGRRRKSRQKLKKDIRQKGKININKFLQEFKPGERVALKADSTYQKGMFPLRFYGKIGTVKEKKGKGYEIIIRDENKTKHIISHPVHLKRL